MEEPTAHPDSFRSIDHVLKPDPRQEAFTVLDEKGARPKTLEDHHWNLKHYLLHDGVPEEVRVHFDTARNLALYAWFAYRFLPVAQMHAYASLEFALRRRFAATNPAAAPGTPRTKRGRGKTNRGELPSFRRMLRRAVEEGIIRGDHTHRFLRIAWGHDYLENSMKHLYGDAYIPRVLDPRGYLDQIADALPVLRNDLAHGSKTLSMSAYGTIELCADLINQLFPRPDELRDGSRIEPNKA